MLKMLMDPMGGIVMTNDGNAILREVRKKTTAAVCVSVCVCVFMSCVCQLQCVMYLNWSAVNWPYALLDIRLGVLEMHFSQPKD